MSGYYHQDERDSAAAAGCLVVIAIALLFAGIAVGVAVAMVAGAGDATHAELDGSNAGANAVRVEELQYEGSHPCQ